MREEGYWKTSSDASRIGRHENCGESLAGMLAPCTSVFVETYPFPLSLCGDARRVQIHDLHWYIRTRASWSNRDLVLTSGSFSLVF